MQKKNVLFSYVGIDISSEMTRAANTLYGQLPDVRFVNSSKPDQSAHYGIASGIFNVRLKKTDTEWYHHIQATLDFLYETSLDGFAFNCLTSYSDSFAIKDYLYYADPCQLFDLCKRRYSSQVALLHDYGLYEFTILVRKI